MRRLVARSDGLRDRVRHAETAGEMTIDLDDNVRVADRPARLKPGVA
jgi:hypothetical protein